MVIVDAKGDSLSATSAEIRWLVTRIDELTDPVSRMVNDEIRSRSQSMLGSCQRGEESPELRAEALALARETLRRTAGVLPDTVTIGVALEAIEGVTRPLPPRTDTRSALVMGLYWHSLAGRGVHFVGLDESGAKSLCRFFEPLGALLGCDCALVASSMSGEDLRRAYAAMVTFGSWEQLAVDYLRDNLVRSRADVVQRGLQTAVVDDAYAMLRAKARTLAWIDGPRVDFDPPGLDVTSIASSFRKRRDYQVDRGQAEIWLTGSSIQRLKSAVGWSGVPQPAAVTAAERIEAAIARKEGVGGSDAYQKLATISLSGLLRAYRMLTYLSPPGGSGGTLDEILMEAATTAAQRRELALEQLVDHHRAELYAYRSRVRDAPDALVLVEPLVADAVRVWHSQGSESLISGLRRVLMMHRDDTEISTASSSDHPDAIGRSVRLIGETIQRRVDSLGRSRMDALARAVILRLIDSHWRMHLARMQFLRRQSNALYDASGMIEARAADVIALFDACQQSIRVDSIRYMLEANLTKAF